MHHLIKTHQIGLTKGTLMSSFVAEIMSSWIFSIAKVVVIWWSRLPLYRYSTSSNVCFNRSEMSWSNWFNILSSEGAAELTSERHLITKSIFKSSAPTLVLTWLTLESTLSCNIKISKRFDHKIIRSNTWASFMHGWYQLSCSFRGRKDNSWFRKFRTCGRGHWLC